MHGHVGSSRAGDTLCSHSKSDINPGYQSLKNRQLLKETNHSHSLLYFVNLPTLFSMHRSAKKKGAVILVAMIVILFSEIFGCSGLHSRTPGG